MSIPSRGFAKLDSGIIDSTLWTEPHDVLRVWIALLAKCDSFGLVRAAVPAMAHLCFVTVERFEAIIESLCGPDEHSRTEENEGRRLQKVDGGWCIINYILYREMMQRKAMSHADRQKRYRERVKERDALVTSQVTGDTEAEAEAEAERSKESTLRVEVALASDAPPAVNGNGHSKPEDARKRCPFTEIVSLYHESLPDCPRVEKLTDSRKGYLRQRWLDDLPTLDAWRNYFTDVAASRFLTGRVEGREGKRPFLADLEWLSRPGNFAKVAEGKYHQ